MIVAVHRKWQCIGVELVDRRLKEALPRLNRKVLDVEIAIKFKRKAYLRPSNKT